jgi:DNA-binding XRE family transcriptional regulator
MAKLTKADAARQLGIARSTLYKLIDQGKVSPTPDGLIDQAELVRVAAYVDTLTGRSRTLEEIHETPAPRHAETAYERPHTDVHEHRETDARERPQTSADVLVDILREQIQVLRDELQEARAERQAAREREAHLLRLVEQMHQRYDRLLDTPRSAAPAPAPPPVRTQRPQRSGPSAYDPSPAIARILTLRQQGLSFEAIAAQLTQEGIPTRYGLPWQHSSVRYLFRTYGDVERHD